MKPYFFEEKTKPEANHLPLKKRFVWKGDSATTSTNCATPASKCATHDSICATPASDFEEPLSNSITPDSPSKKVIFNSAVDNFSTEASQGMDKKVLFAVPSCIEGRSEVKCSKAYSPEIFLHPNSAHEDVLPSSESDSAHEDIPPSSEFEITPFASLNSTQKDASLSIRPTNSETSSPIESETYSRKVDPSDFITPKKVSFKEHDAPKVTEDPSPRITTPSSSQPASTCRKKKKNQLAIVTSTLIASSLTSNVESHSVLRPKRRPSKAPLTQEVFPPLKKSPSSSLEMHPSSSSSNKVSMFTSDFKFHLDSCEFPSSAIITSDDAKPKKIEDAKKKTFNLEKKDFNMSTIFSSSKKSSATFRGILKKSTFTSYSLPPHGNNVFNISSEHLVSRFKCSPEHRGFHHKTHENVFKSITSGLPSHTSFKPSSRNIYESKFKHLKNSRFVSTSFVFRKRDASSNENDSSSTSKTHSSLSKCSTHHKEEMSKFDPPTKSSPILKTNPCHPPSNSSPSCSPATEEGTSPDHNAFKEIKGPNKTLDSLHYETIFEKTSGTHKTFSSSHLGTSIFNKSKAAKHNKSSPKTKSIPTCYPRSTSRSRCSTLPRLVDGEQTLCFISVFLMFIILLLLCFFIS